MEGRREEEREGERRKEKLNTESSYKQSSRPTLKGEWCLCLSLRLWATALPSTHSPQMQQKCKEMAL